MTLTLTLTLTLALALDPSQAKTIDLCNNPLTKEPKLDQARRLGGTRWLALDSRVEDLMIKAAKDVGASTAAKDEL